MGGVGDELPLGVEHLSQPLGHVVERVRDLAVLARPLRLGARLQVAGLDAPRRRSKVLERARERPGQHPREGEPQDEGDQADADQAEDVAANPPIDRLDALRNPHRADAILAAHDRHSRVEQ